jgi:hypothetical protein
MIANHNFVVLRIGTPITFSELSIHLGRGSIGGTSQAVLLNLLHLNPLGIYCQVDTFCNSCMKLQPLTPLSMALKTASIRYGIFYSLQTTKELGFSMRTNSSRLALAVCTLLCLGLTCCQKAPPHSVTLTWDPPRAVPGKSVVAYNVYRSTTSGVGFVKLASHVPGPPYEDRLVQSGRTYYYVVTALDQTGQESGFSGEVRATIP